MSVYYKNTAIRQLIPTDINNCVLWLDGADAATVHFSSGVLVDQWDDKSGQANHAVQLTPANQPTYVLAGLNGKNIIQCDINKFLTTPFNVDLSATEQTIFVVANTTAGVGDFRTPVTSRTNTPSRGYLFFAHTTNVWQFWTGKASGGWSITVGKSVVLSQWEILSGHVKSLDKEFWINGVSQGTDVVQVYVPNTISDAAFGATEVGGSSLQGNLSDILIYDRILNADERAALNGYLSQKSGIVLP